MATPRDAAPKMRQTAARKTAARTRTEDAGKCGEDTHPRADLTGRGQRRRSSTIRCKPVASHSMVVRVPSWGGGARWLSWGRCPGGGGGVLSVCPVLGGGACPISGSGLDGAGANGIEKCTVPYRAYGRACVAQADQNTRLIAATGVMLASTLRPAGNHWAPTMTPTRLLQLYSTAGATPKR